MSYIKKPLEELDVIDDFLMNAVTSICKSRESATGNEVRIYEI